MKIFAFALMLVAGTAANAGEAIKGKTSSVASDRTWETGPNAGYFIYTSNGEAIWETGPFDDQVIECHGAGFWTPLEITGEGICIFGEEPDRWTYVQVMPKGSNLWADKSNFSDRQGVWEVVHGTGRFAGMTGAGTFTVRNPANGDRITEFEGEIDLN